MPLKAPPPRRLIRAHQAMAGLATLLFAAVVMALEPAAPLRVGLLAVAVAVLGLPHGAVDHLEGRAYFAPRCGRWWPAAFGVAYIGAALAVIGVWLLVPPLGLVAFLLLACWHFGAEDSQAAPLPADRWAAGVMLRGALPILAPIVAFPDATGAHFAVLMPGVETQAVRLALADFVRPGALLALGVYAGAWLHALARGDLWQAGEVLLITGTGLVLPPLMFFVVYFCFWHGPRHSLRSVWAMRGAGDGRALRRYAIAAAWPTALTLVVAASFIGWRFGDAAVDGVVLRAVFIGLAALTVPHVGLSVLRAQPRRGPAP